MRINSSASTLALEAKDSILAALGEKEAGWEEAREGWGEERAKGEVALMEAMKVVKRLEREVERKEQENAAWARKTEEVGREGEREGGREGGMWVGGGGGESGEGGGDEGAGECGLG